MDTEGSTQQLDTERELISSSDAKVKDQVTLLCGKVKIEEDSEEEEETDKFKIKFNPMTEELSADKLINRAYIVFFLLIRTTIIVVILFGSKYPVT